MTRRPAPLSGVLLAGCAAIALAPGRPAPAGEAANRPIAGRFVRIESGTGPKQDYLHFAELEVYVGGRNVAVGRPVTASSTMRPFAPPSWAGAFPWISLS